MVAQKDKLLVSIVAPFFNEEDSLVEFFERIVTVTNTLLDQYEFEFVFIDDCSRDRSLKIAHSLIAKDSRLKIVELRRNYGQSAALQAGMDSTEGDIIISMDSDLQHFPEDIPKFLDKIEEGSDVVCGWRRGRQEGIVRRWPSRVANFLIRKVSGLTINDIGTTFRAYKSEIIQDMVILGENHRFIPVFAKEVGARICEIPIQNIDRPHGQSNYGLSRTINVLIDIFFLYFFVKYIDRPIRIFGKFALGMLSFAGVITIVLAVIWLNTGQAVVREHSGWFILAVIFYLASAQFLLTGVLSEMLARVYFSTWERSHYKIRKIWTHDNL